jgi:hypothetical protein
VNREWLIDILRNSRLSCRRREDLNDPFEGQFRAKYLRGKETTIQYKEDGTHFTTMGIWEELNQKSEELKTLNEKIKNKRICSLTDSFKNMLLWAHYADSHRGVAIEVDIPEEDAKKITYFSKKLPVLLHGPNSKIEEREAERALTSKSNHWDYENEYRILVEGDFYDLKTRVKKVYCGAAMNQDILESLRSEFSTIKFIKMELLDKSPWIREERKKQV